MEVALMSAAGLFALALGLIEDMRGGLRVFGGEVAGGRAGCILLAELGERHAELEQRIGRLVAGFVLLVALEEGVGRALVLAAHIIALADPVLRAAGERIVGVGGDQLAERGLRRAVVAL